MRHIRQINTETYTVDIANEPLEEHLSLIEHPNLFELVDCEIPNNAQYLNYE